MNKKLVVASMALALAFSSKTFGQLNMAGLGASLGVFKAEDISLENQLAGGHGFIETPLGGYSARFDMGYLSQLEKEPANPSLDYLLSIRLGYGKVFGEGKRLQLPLFAQASINSSKGDLQLKSWGAGARGGIRFFFTQKLAFYADINFDYIFAQDVKFIDALGAENTLDLKPLSVQINIGFLFMYIKKE